MPSRRFSSDDLRRLAGQTVFNRGEEYARSGAVRLRLVTTERVEAEVSGGEIYEVTLAIPRAGGIEADCTCPHADGGSFCKHAVAAGLAALKQGVSEKTGPRRLSDKELIAGHLTAMTKEALVVRLMKVVGATPGLKRALLSEAIAAHGSVEDKAPWRRLIETTFRATRTMGRESAGDFPEALAGVERAFRSVLSTKTAPLFLDLIEEVIRRAEKASEEVRDEAGRLAESLKRLGDLHRDACPLAGLTPESLAERLFALEIGHCAESVSFGPENYVEVLSPAGLRRYRELVEEKARMIPDDRDLHARRVTLAGLCGDTDA